MKRIVIYFLFCLILLIAIPIILFNFSNNNLEIISPLANAKTSLETKINKPIKTPTSTPSLAPTITPKPTITLSPTLPLSPTAVPISNQDLDSLFTKYANYYSVDKELLKKIAKCESNFNTNAVFKDYVGLYQFSKNTWISARNLMGQDNNPEFRIIAEEAIKTAAFKISSGELSAWPNCNK